jgi:integrase/recombinase XerD
LQKGIRPERQRQLIQQMIQVVNSHMKNIASKLGITSKTTTYPARHSFATILQGSGGSTSFISEALGHSNVLTTKAIWQGLKMNPKRNH